MVRADVSKLNPLAAAAALSARARELSLADGECAILPQNFGMAGGDQSGPEWKVRGTTALFAHGGDSVAAGSCSAPWLTPWFSQGIAQCRPWMDTMVQALASAVTTGSMPAPSRFHFDSEGWPQVVEQPLAAGEAFRAMQADARWSSEAVPGFGISMEDLWIRSGRPQCEPTAEWFRPVNHAWTIWYQGVLFTASSAALEACTGASIRGAWPACGVSNYVLSASFDGVDGRLDVDSRNPWLTTSHACASSMQAPQMYPVAKQWCDANGGAGDDCSLAYHDLMLTRMARSFGGMAPDRFAPWIELPELRIEGSQETRVTASYLVRIVGLLRTRGIRECIVWDQTSGSQESAWNTLALAAGFEL